MRCPNCDSEMSALFTSLFCPSAQPPAAVCEFLHIVIVGQKWRAMRLAKGVAAPSWATRAWQLSGGSQTEDPRMSDADLITAMTKKWVNREAPGWALSSSENLSQFPHMVFGPLSGGGAER